jgi:hypothetical protein
MLSYPAELPIIGLLTTSSLNLKMAAFCDMELCSFVEVDSCTASIIRAIIITLLMEKALTSSMSTFFYDTTRHHIAEGDTRRLENS